MGYRDRVFSMKCGACSAVYVWSWKEPDDYSLPKRWRCNRCKASNETGSFDRLPNVPQTLYLGHEKHQQLKVLATPVMQPRMNEEAFPPYSIRSFLYQVSARLGGCNYYSERQGLVLADYVFVDRCRPDNADDWDEGRPCHMAGGWIHGQPTCLLWEKVKSYCQTDDERQFLHTYYGLVKDRQFPMALPQVRIGIGERRRPDFVIFVPLQHLRYKRYAIELDRYHDPSRQGPDHERDIDLAMHGYEVISLRPRNRGYGEEAKRLVERIELEMTQVDSDKPGVAIEVPVKSWEPELTDDDIPF